MARLGSTALGYLAVAVFSTAAWGQNVECNCDPAQPATMEARQCSLCREAEKQSPEIELFFLKDNNPRKPNRWLVLPRAHQSGRHHFHEAPEELRRDLWNAAIGKGRELFGEEWGVAYNGEKVRTQCHLHLHIGRFITAAENDRFIVVSSVDEIPVPPGEGVWIHPVNGKLHVHYGEQICETALVR